MTKALSLSVLLLACGSSPTAPADGGDTESGVDAAAPSAVPEFGKLTVIGTKADGLAGPRDLAFAPAHPGQLWTVNVETEGVVIYHDAGTSTQTFEARVDMYARHFMAKVSSFAFGENNQFATCQESRDDWNDVPQPEDDFMGPTLWLADLDIFAKIGQTFPYVSGQLEGSHIDMLHESPLCMGIAWEKTNVFWAVDGLHNQIVYYDFAKDHGPGGGNHQDGVVRRYGGTTVTRVAGIPSHAVRDPGSAWLYVADTGTGKIMRLDTSTGTSAGKPTIPAKELLAEYTQMNGATWEEFATGLGKPSGIAIEKDRLFVSDNATGAIVCYSLADKKELGRMQASKGIMGITFDGGKLWFVNRDENTVVRVDP